MTDQKSPPPVEGAGGGDPNPRPRLGDIKKEPSKYRLTKWSIPWLVAFVLLVPFEIVMAARDEAGGPLTYVVRWAYGEPLSMRWWLLGWANSGFIAWMVPHFLDERFDLRWLVGFVAAGFVLGLVGWLVTR